jgi:RND family efflux transporter MFP subunit
MNKKYLFISYIVLLVGIYSCSRINKDSISKESVKSFNVIQPLQLDTVYNIKFVADVQAKRHIELRSKVSGYIRSIYVDEGQRVRKGDLLFKIHDLEYKEQLLKAQSQLMSAEAQLASKILEHRNTLSLFEDELISESEVSISKANLDAVSSAVEVAKSRVSSAELNLQYTEIRAPYDGVLNRIHYREGSLINSDEILTTLSDDKVVYTYFSVSENDYFTYFNNIELEDLEVELILPDGKVYSELGTIDAIEGIFDKETGSVSIRAKFNNSNYFLKHGATGTIIIKRLLKNALLIPQRSTFEIQDKIFAFVVDKNNIVEARPIKIIRRIGNCYAVERGIDYSSKIIYEGVKMVRSGQSISINEIPFRD